MNTDRDQLKNLIRTEPTIAATFAEVDGEHAAAIAYAATLKKRRDELQSQLDEIEHAKSQLATSAPKPKGEPAPDPAPAANPILKGTNP